MPDNIRVFIPLIPLVLFYQKGSVHEEEHILNTEILYYSLKSNVNALKGQVAYIWLVTNLAYSETLIKGDVWLIVTKMDLSLKKIYNFKPWL